MRARASARARAWAFAEPHLPAAPATPTDHNETLRSDAVWAAFDASEWGFAVVDAFNRSALRVQFRANVDGGRVRDEAWIMRPERV